MKTEPWLRARIELRKGQLAQTTVTLPIVVLTFMLAELEEVLSD